MTTGLYGEALPDDPEDGLAALNELFNARRESPSTSSSSSDSAFFPRDAALPEEWELRKTVVIGQADRKD